MGSVLAEHVPNAKSHFTRWSSWEVAPGCPLTRTADCGGVRRIITTFDFPNSRRRAVNGASQGHDMGSGGRVRCGDRHRCDGQTLGARSRPPRPGSGHGPGGRTRRTSGWRQSGPPPVRDCRNRGIQDRRRHLQGAQGPDQWHGIGAVRDSEVRARQGFRVERAHQEDDDRCRIRRPGSEQSRRALGEARRPDSAREHRLQHHSGPIERSGTGRGRRQLPRHHPDAAD